METLDARQSGMLSIINRDQIDRTHTSTSTMAATAVVSPTSMYSNGPPPPYSFGWPGPSAHTMSGLISPADSRRTSDNKLDAPPAPQSALPPRLSLPSIHEALSSGPKPNSYGSPVSTSFPTSHHQPSYPQSQAQPSIPRSYPAADHGPYQKQLATSLPRNVSPLQPVQPQPASFPRPESIPVTFSENSRHPPLTSLQTGPTPPRAQNPYPGSHYEPPTRYDSDHRAPERMTNSYPHNPPPPQQAAYSYASAPSQAPTSAHQAASYSQPRHQSRDGREPDGWKVGREEESMVAPPFKAGLKRHLDVWDFENNLAQINVSSSVLQEWSRHYNAIAQEQQRSVNVMPDRMPTLDSCNEMLEHNEKILFALQRMKDTIYQQEHAALAEQRMREQGGKGVGEYDEEMSNYGDEMKNQGFGGSEGKKRRGRAAPPGRCHSCNRAETPEWRRGPDGARTLCNACGLHYAKLTRKNTMKQSQGANGSSLRPKSMEDHSPRPL